MSNLCIPFAKGGKKRQDVVEGCRKTLVGAIKTGATFVLYLGKDRRMLLSSVGNGCLFAGHATAEHADWKTKLCKKVISR